MWTTIEAVGMYLSLVQVFGSHVSGFILKASAVAWGRLITIIRSCSYKVLVKLTINVIATFITSNIIIHNNYNNF